jgi:hypothetical protein
VGGVLLEELSEDQRRLLEVVYEPFHYSGDWPVWQFADLTMERRYGLDAAAVLASLPRAAGLASHGYGLTWRTDWRIDPQPQNEIALTVAGLCHVADAAVTLSLFCRMVALMTGLLADLVPDPSKVVSARVSSDAVASIAREDKAISREVNDLPPVGGGLVIAKRRIRRLMDHEPFAFSYSMPSQAEEEWTVEVPPVLRAFRHVTTPEGYVEQVLRLVVPPEPPSAPLSPAPLDIPYAIGYLDAVWRAATGSRLFVNIDPASDARLTLECGSEEEFNSLISALADVLGQVVKPEVSRPPQGGALEEVRDWLVPQLDAAAADRVSVAFATLIELRRIRVATQHSDARQKTVRAFREIGLQFPPPRWEQAWAHVVVTARGALDTIREEVHAALGHA